MSVQGFNRPGDGAGGLKIPDKLNFVANLNAKNQPSTMADSVAALIGKVANLGYVGSKRWASGTTTSSSSTLSFSSTNAYYITVSGLTFQPSIIIISVKNSGGSTYFETLYSVNSSLHTGILPIRYNSLGNSVDSTGNAYVNSTGFRLPTDVNNPSIECKWIAVE